MHPRQRRICSASGLIVDSLPTYLPVPVACDLLLSGVSLVRETRRGEARRGEARRGVYVELALVRGDVDVDVDVDVV